MSQSPADGGTGVAVAGGPRLFAERRPSHARANNTSLVPEFLCSLHYLLPASCRSQSQNVDRPATAAAAEALAALLAVPDIYSPGGRWPCPVLPSTTVPSPL